VVSDSIDAAAPKPAAGKRGMYLVFAVGAAIM
jgi:hypothetical protein